MFELSWVRDQFPSLARTVNGQPAVFMDGPGGTQVPQRVIDAIAEYLKHNNANTCGAYATSRNTDVVIAGARGAMADFLNCDSSEIVFGANMTSLTFAISRSIGRELGPGDEIVLTRLDHSANVSPWQALEERGVTVRVADIHERDCTLDMNDLAGKITSKTKLVAVGYASNAVGTINPVREIIRLAHERGALVFGGLIVLVAAAHFLSRLPDTVLFWAAYVLTRPLGATLGDTLTKPHAEGGLNLGRIGSSLAIAVLMVLLIATTTLRKRASGVRRPGGISWERANE